MPLQNRVTPFGEIVAVAARGLFIGNRGIIHDPATRTLLNRRWTSRAWLICALEHKGIRRRVMGPGSWTELFFLDEAVALAAGHRPCFECRRAEAEAFRAAWAKGAGRSPPRAAEIDLVLHAERLSGRGKRRHTLDGSARPLPDGAMVAAGDDAFLVLDGRLRRWTPSGYVACEAAPAGAQILTPPSTLLALAAGYRPRLHPSARIDGGGGRRQP